MRPYRLVSRFLLGAIVLSVAGSAEVAAAGFTIFDAINEAASSNPGVGEAAADRRATESGLRQSQSLLLPQIHLDASGGQGRFNQQDITPPPLGNNQWLPGYQGSVIVRQKVFDGLASLNEVWRQAARVDASAYRVRERTELTALDAAEAYIDVVRFNRLITIATDNLTAHRRLLANVEARFSGGRSGEGDLEQTRERVAAAEATLAEFEQNLDAARATYRRVVGQEPANLRSPGRLKGLPAGKDAALTTALQFNPTLRAAKADVEAAKYAFHGTAGAFVPTVSLEGSATRGKNVGDIFGRETEASGKVVMSWDVFTAGLDSWKRSEAAERYTEATLAQARLERAAFESLDKAWGARTITSDRVAALLRQVASDRKAIDAYTKEYELGQRSLIDLLNAENQFYNALISLEASRSVAVFADYQLLAAMGELLVYVKSPVPLEADPLETVPIGIFPTKLPPIIIDLPQTPPDPRDRAHSPGRLQFANESAARTVYPWWTSGVSAFDKQFPGGRELPPATSSGGPDWIKQILSMPLSAGGPR